MIKIISDSNLVSFDGRVLEIFLSRGETKRFHSDLIQTIELEERKGKYAIKLEYTALKMPEKISIHDSKVAQARELILAVQKSKE